MVQTEDTSVSGVIDQRRIIDLPLNGRQATQLIMLSGVAASAPAGDLPSSKNYPNSATLSVAGGQANGTNFLLDGGDNNDAFSNVNLPFPFPDALQEFSVQTTGLSACYGLHPGAVVSIVTKSGSNSIHGMTACTVPKAVRLKRPPAAAASVSRYTQSLMARLCFLFLLGCASTLAQDSRAEPWKFAVSGDSRNCGDIVMPAIASGVLQNRAQFYWHLGDFRAIYAFDEDLVPPEKLHLPSKPLNIRDYESKAWPDFIARQLVPFGDLPIFLTPGNHEAIAPMNRDRYRAQFADWLTAPRLRAQRLADDPQDHALHTYFHWVERNVDFIALDNASDDQFDSEQLKWFHALIARDEASSQIRTIVVGMHAALPGSFGSSHSMSDWAQGEKSGRDVYAALWHAQDSAHKRVYLLASHSHFYMEDIYRTPYWKDKVLPGWIVGTAGAVRYRLPAGASSGRRALTDVYGYLIGTVAADASISFSFQELSLDDLLRVNQGNTPAPLVRWCYDENKQ